MRSRRPPRRRRLARAATIASPATRRAAGHALQPHRGEMLGWPASLAFGQHRDRRGRPARRRSVRAAARAGLAQPGGALARAAASARPACARRACRGARCRETRAGTAGRRLRRTPASRANSASVSVGKPAIRSAPIAIPGRSARARSITAERLGAQVPALHALQDQIAAGLQRQMQMRHQARLFRDQPPQIVVDRGRIERRQPQPRQLRHQRQQPAHQLAQASARRAGRRRRTGDVDAGQHHLAEAGLDQGAHLRHHRAHRHAADRAAAERDDAEGAAMVAALLHLHEGAGAAGELGDQMRRGLARRHDVGDRDGRVRRPALRLQLLRVAEHPRDAGQRGPARRGRSARRSR